jgi:putative spermidine/putrescine transport system ATP-binding protein
MAARVRECDQVTLPQLPASSAKDTPVDGLRPSIMQRGGDPPVAELGSSQVSENPRERERVEGRGHVREETKWMVELRSVSKSFGRIAALSDVSLGVRDGEFFTLLGPSGSGKTTVLRIIAGLVEADEGEILIGGTSMSGVPSFERELAVVFQSLALFPHMSVAENIAFSLRMRRRPRAEIAKAVREVLELVQLPDIGDRNITELSGGQRQRVALARSLVYGPRLLLLDEPLSALDRRLREDMQLELTRLHRELGVTIINVTHDQHEALFVSDRVAVMNNGKIVQIGHGREIYDRPASEFVAAFLGDPFLLAGRITRSAGDPFLETGSLRLRVSSGAPEGPATVLLRPERLRLLRGDSDASTWDNALRGRVIFASFDGTGVFVQVALEAGFTVSVHTTMRDTLEVAVGDDVKVAWNADEAAVVSQEVP